MKTVTECLTSIRLFGPAAEAKLETIRDMKHAEFYSIATPELIGKINAITAQLARGYRCKSACKPRKRRIVMVRVASAV